MATALRKIAPECNVIYVPSSDTHPGERIDAHQLTTVVGLYAAGDVAKGLDQISRAMGEAGVAATTVRNDLALKRRLFR